MGKGCQKAYPKRTDLRKKCESSGREAIIKDNIADANDAKHEAFKHKMPKKCASTRMTFAKKLDHVETRYKKEGATQSVVNKSNTLYTGRTAEGIGKCISKAQKKKK